jgi:hypothetical protein
MMHILYWGGWLKNLSKNELDLSCSTLFILWKSPFDFEFSRLLSLKLSHLNLRDDFNTINFPVLKGLVLHNVWFKCCEVVVRFIKGGGTMLETLIVDKLHIPLFAEIKYVVVTENLPCLLYANLDDVYLPLELVSNSQTLVARLVRMYSFFI